MPKRKAINTLSTRHVRRLIEEETSIRHQHFLDEQRSKNLDNEENPIASNVASNSPSPVKYSNEQISDAVQVNEVNIEEVSFCSSNNNSSLEENNCNDAFQINAEYRENEAVNINQQLQKVELKVRLAEWAVERNISHSDLSALLKVLKTDPHNSDLPTDPRTLLQTPRHTEIKEIAPGFYWHYGLGCSLINFIEQNSTMFDKFENTISLSINVDGLPLSKSSTSVLWPILGCLIDYSMVFLIGAYHGNCKPSDAAVFLEDFVTETIDLVRDGLNYNGKIYKVVIKQIICDAPAKAFILNVKTFSGFSSCTKCCVEGDFRKNRVCFLENDARRRTDEDFVNQTDDRYHLGRSILADIPNLGLVTNVVLDYLHVICLGIMRKILNDILSGELQVRLPHFKVELISQHLIELRLSIPVEFVRKPRSLKYLAQWKGTEFRQFLLYTGPVVLESVLSPSLYHHFVSLSVAVTIMCSPSLSKQYLDYAQQLLNHFVQSYKILYGEHKVSHNVHNLIHMPDDVKNFGVLDSFSAFKFENFMQYLKKLVRKLHKPLQQLNHRYAELKNILHALGAKEKQRITPGVRNLHTNGILVDGCVDPQYKEVVFKEYVLRSNNQANSCCGLRQGNVVFVENIAFNTAINEFVIIGKEYEKKNDFFKIPCSSSILGIYVVDKLSKRKWWRISDICQKFVRLPYVQTSYIVFPLLHTNDLPFQLLKKLIKVKMPAASKFV